MICPVTTNRLIGGTNLVKEKEESVRDRNRFAAVCRYGRFTEEVNRKKNRNATGIEKEPTMKITEKKGTSGAICSKNMTRKKKRRPL